MILCCGEALIDFVQIPGKRAYMPCPGGSVFNIAVGLGRLKIPVGFLCRMSTDFFSDMLLDVLVENNVDTSLCRIVPDPTMLAFVSLDQEGQAEPQFSFYANGSAAANLDVSELPDSLAEEIKVLHFGSLSLVLEPTATALEVLMARESGHRIISLDPNIRPDLIPDRSAYRQRFENWLASVDILKLSQADRQWIYPDCDLDQNLERWFGLGVSLVIETRGEGGAEGFSADGKRAFVEAPRVIVVDTVGAGDAFISAALAWLTDGNVMDPECLRDLPADQIYGCLAFATRAAAINCTRVGADPPNWQEIQDSIVDF